MLAPREMPDFKEPDQRSAWIKEHAQHFTCSYRKRTVIVHTEHPSLHEAQGQLGSLLRLSMEA